MYDCWFKFSGQIKLWIYNREYKDTNFTTKIDDQSLEMFQALDHILIKNVYFFRKNKLHLSTFTTSINLIK